jgi:hypothetical protein
MPFGAYFIPTYFVLAGDVFDSYRVTNGVSTTNQNDDPYDYVYHNLPRKHHALKPVKDCEHCGAMRIQYEGPAFCCRKGKVKIATPEVPQELRRLFTSQVDEDAKYFRKHIRYFNSHFSFTSLGVTLDKTVSTASKTGVYTFRAQGALYYKMDDLVPGGQGPRHLQLYFYDTDETLEHRVKRSPDLDINIVRAILKILEDNQYVQTFKSIGSVPNLDEYRISLNTVGWTNEGTMRPQLPRWPRCGLRGVTHKIPLIGKLWCMAKGTVLYLLELTMVAMILWRIHYSSREGRRGGTVGYHMRYHVKSLSKGTKRMTQSVNPCKV